MTTHEVLLHIKEEIQKEILETLNTPEEYNILGLKRAIEILDNNLEIFYERYGTSPNYELVKKNKNTGYF
jgi:hypothetical protein